MVLEKHGNTNSRVKTNSQVQNGTQLKDKEKVVSGFEFETVEDAEIFKIVRKAVEDNFKDISGTPDKLFVEKLQNVHTCSYVDQFLILLKLKLVGKQGMTSFEQKQEAYSLAEREAGKFMRYFGNESFMKGPFCESWEKCLLQLQNRMIGADMSADKMAEYFDRIVNQHDQPHLQQIKESLLEKAKQTSIIRKACESGVEKQ